MSQFSSLDYFRSSSYFQKFFFIYKQQWCIHKIISKMMICALHTVNMLQFGAWIPFWFWWYCMFIPVCLHNLISFKFTAIQYIVYIDLLEYSILASAITANPSGHDETSICWVEQPEYSITIYYLSTICCVLISLSSAVQLVDGLMAQCRTMYQEETPEDRAKELQAEREQRRQEQFLVMEK